MIVLLLCVIPLNDVYAASKVKNNGKKITVLTYHQFGWEITTPDDKIYKVLPSDFEKQVSTLINKGYTFVNDEDLYKYYYEGHLYQIMWCI